MLKEIIQRKITYIKNTAQKIRLEAAIRKEEGCADVTIIRSSVGPTIGSHVGPGMVACAFWGKNRADKASLSDRIARRVRGQ